MANAELRLAKSAAHAAFDPIWMTANRLSRSQAYALLAERLGIARSEAHIGMFDADQCKAVIAAFAGGRDDLPFGRRPGSNVDLSLVRPDDVMPWEGR